MLVDEAYGVVSLFVQNIEGEMFGVTNTHITNYTHKCYTVKTTEKQDHLLFGKPFTKTAGIDRVDGFKESLDLFKVNEAFQKRVGNVVVDVNGEVRKIVLYDGPIEKLYGKQVTKLRSSFAEFQINADDTSIGGEIKSKDFHTTLGIQNKPMLLVKGESGPFSRPGDSGSPVVLCDDSSNELILVGVVAGGMFGNTECDTLCMFLPDVINVLEERYSMKLSMKVCNTLTHTCVPVGCRIYLNCSQVPTLRTIQSMFDLASTMANTQFIDCDMYMYRVIWEREKSFRHLIYDGKSFPLNERLDECNPVSQALWHSMKAFYAILNGLNADAELYLYIAFELTAKCPDLMLWLFSKNACILTWYLSSVTDPSLQERVHRFLGDLAIFYENNRGKNGFPRELDVNIPLATSQYYQNSYNDMRNGSLESKVRTVKSKILRKDSMDLLKCAMTFAKEQYLVRPTPFCLTRLLSVKCQLAYCLLGCGHGFYNVNNDDIALKDIHKAKTLLDDVEEHQDCSTPFVKVKYLIAKSDYCFRVNRQEERMTTLKDCKKLATSMELRSEIYRAHRRMQTNIEEPREIIPNIALSHNKQTRLLLWILLTIRVFNATTQRM